MNDKTQHAFFLRSSSVNDIIVCILLLTSIPDSGLNGTGTEADIPSP